MNRRTNWQNRCNLRISWSRIFAALGRELLRGLIEKWATTELHNRRSIVDGSRNGTNNVAMVHQTGGFERGTLKWLVATLTGHGHISLKEDRSFGR